MFAGESSLPLVPITGVLLPAEGAAENIPGPPVLPSRWCIEGVLAKELAPMLRRGKYSREVVSPRSRPPAPLSSSSIEATSTEMSFQRVDTDTNDIT
jgi:hypothetical protein